MILGQASSAKAEQAGKLAENMADLAWTFASKEGFRIFNKQHSLLDSPSDVTSHTKRSYSTNATSSGKACDSVILFVVFMSSILTLFVERWKFRFVDVLIFQVTSW